MTANGTSFDLIATDGAARRGRLSTAHGDINTPAFMPVGTAGTVKSHDAGRRRGNGSRDNPG